MSALAALWPFLFTERFLTYSALTMAASGVLVVVLLSSGLRAFYGRYVTSAKWWGPPVDSRVAWFLQEVPSLLVPLAFLPTAKSE
jgi:hypothetical protein